MKIVIDADGCPVVNESVRIAKLNNIDITLVCDTSHEFNIVDVSVVTVSKGADSADFKIVNMLQKGDIVVTQDYGLASMCLAKGAFCLNQDGKEYTSDNIDALLLFRHTAKKIRQSGGRIKGNQKRDKKTQNKMFEQSLIDIIDLHK